MLEGAKGKAEDTLDMLRAMKTSPAGVQLLRGGLVQARLEKCLEPSGMKSLGFW